jgi:glycosyltransferase involved in cell wall biosynthesis
VIIPAYNRSQFLAAAIESVLGQSYRDFEIIVVDDGSTDGTGEVVAGYGELVRCFRQENGGAARARNTGLAQAGGEYVAFLDSDDLMLPRRLEYQVEALDRFPEAGLVHGRAVSFSGQPPVEARGAGAASPPMSVRDIFEEMLLANRILTLTVTARRCCLDRVGGFAEGLSFGEDYDLWLRISAHHPVAFVEAEVAAYRVHAGNISSKALLDGRQAAAHLRVLDRILSHLPAKRQTTRLHQLAGRRRRLIGIERACHEFFTGDRGRALQALARLLPTDAESEEEAELVAATLLAYGEGFDAGSSFHPRSTELLGALRERLPRHPRLRSELGRHLAFRHGRRAWRWLEEGRRLRAIAEALRALRCRPDREGLGTLASVLRRLAGRGKAEGRCQG